MDIRRDAAILAVRVTPGAKLNAVTAIKEGVWNIKIAAPPVEGRANEELVVFLSKKLGIHRNSLNIIKGQSNRNKLVSVSGMHQKEIARRLSAELDI
jgi:uncharacterized protein (TIGR00251 family)